MQYLFASVKSNQINPRCGYQGYYWGTLIGCKNNIFTWFLSDKGAAPKVRHLFSYTCSSTLYTSQSVPGSLGLKLAWIWGLRARSEGGDLVGICETLFPSLFFQRRTNPREGWLLKGKEDIKREKNHNLSNRRKLANIEKFHAPWWLNLELIFGLLSSNQVFCQFSCFVSDTTGSLL